MTSYTVSAGHTSSGITLNTGDFGYVDSGGKAISTTVSGAELVVSSGGTGSGTTVLGADFPAGAEGTVVVSGGTVVGTTVSAGGDLSVYAGGTAISTTLLGYYNLESVFSGAKAISTTLDGGNLDIYSGGTASDTTLEDSGYEIVSSGGTTISTTVNSVQYGDLGVAFGGTAIDTVVNDDSVGVNGTAISTTVNNGAFEDVYSGGTSIDTTVNSRGTEWVYVGGTTSGTQVYSGGVQLAYFGSANIGGKTVSTTVNSGGLELVYSGSTASGTAVSAGGTEFVSTGGRANGTTLNSGGYEVVDDGATASGTTVNNGGCLVVVPGGAQSGTKVQAGGAVVSTGVVVYQPNSGVTVYANSAKNIVVEGIVVDGGVDVPLLGIGGGLVIVLPGGTAINTIVDPGGEQDVYGTAIGTEGPINVYSGGTAIGDTGEGYVFSGGMAISTTVSAAGTGYAYLYVLSGGTAGDTTVDFGIEEVSGGVAVGTTLNGNGIIYNAYLYVSSGGTASETTVNGGGYEQVGSGGVAINTIVSSGGDEIVSSGGTVSGIVLSAGGSAVLSAGAVVNGEVVFAGGAAELEIEDLKIPTISGFAETDVIDLPDLPYDPTESATLLVGNVLKIAYSSGITINGISGAQIQFDPTQDFSGDTFSLAEDGSAGTYVTVNAPPPPSGLGFAVAADKGAAGDTFTVAGKGEAGDTVILSDGTAALGSVKVAAGGSWSLTTAKPLGPGAHVLSAREVDVAANTSPSSPLQSITIDSATPDNTVVFLGTAGSDRFTGGPGRNYFYFSAANLANTDSITGGSGVNNLVVTTAGPLAALGVRGVQYYWLDKTGADSLTLANTNFAGLAGSAPAITIEGGNAGNNVDASKLTGADRIVAVGGAGTDHFTGGGGNDVFDFSAANLANTDTVAGGGGTNYLVMTSPGAVHALGVSGVEVYELANPAGAADSLALGAANFAGTGGAIWVYGGNPGTTVGLAAGVTASERIVVHAGTVAETATGGPGNDVFYAGGKTMMTGNGGANLFVFTAPGANTIADFAAPTSPGNEIELIAGSGFSLPGATPTPKPLGSLFIQDSAGAFTAATQRFAYGTGNGNLYYSASGSSTPEHLVTHLTGDPTLSAAQIAHLVFAS